MHTDVRATFSPQHWRGWRLPSHLRSIAVVGRDDDGHTGIWLLDPSGGPAVPVLVSLGNLYTPPVWSPGSLSLAFSRMDEATPTAPATETRTRWELWVADGDGSGPHRVPVDGLARAGCCS